MRRYRTPQHVTAEAPKLCSSWGEGSGGTHTSSLVNSHTYTHPYMRFSVRDNPKNRSRLLIWLSTEGEPLFNNSNLPHKSPLERGRRLFFRGWLFCGCQPTQVKAWALPLKPSLRRCSHLHWCSLMISRKRFNLMLSPLATLLTQDPLHTVSCLDTHKEGSSLGWFSGYVLLCWFTATYRRSEGLHGTDSAYILTQ